jgi:hypothetical protein
MNESIWELKQDLVRFFVEEIHGIDIITALKMRLGYHSLEVAYSGITEINIKHRNKYSHIISSNKEETEMVMFVYKASLHEAHASISLYCIRNENVFEFKAKDGKSMIPISPFKGNIGSDMITALIGFKNGGLPKSLVPTQVGVGYDVIKYKRSFN